PPSAPAALTRIKLYGLGIGAQYAISCLRVTLRMKLMPQLCVSLLLKRSVLVGMEISAVQPSSVMRDAVSQMPSQLRLILEFVPRPLFSPSSEICCSSLAPSGVVTNM